MPEEEAFAVLVQIMQQHRMRDMFKPSMAELGVCMYQLENLVLEQFPDLHCHFQSQTFQTTMYASRWFLTLFTTSINLQISCRIMDIFLSEGMEFIFKMALAMLALGKESLLSLDMEAMLKVNIFLFEKMQKKRDFYVNGAIISNAFQSFPSTVLPKGSS